MPPKEINKLVRHVYEECSDLPSLPPLFSCSACDAWRERLHDKGYKNIRRRDFLNDRHQCTRVKEGRPIKVRVICKSAALANPRISSAVTLSLMEEKAKMIALSSGNNERRSSRLRVARSSCNEENQENHPPVEAMGKVIVPDAMCKSKRA